VKCVLGKQETSLEMAFLLCERFLKDTEKKTFR
jgi:hypothetical protein